MICEVARDIVVEGVRVASVGFSDEYEVWRGVMNMGKKLMECIPATCKIDLKEVEGLMRHSLPVGGFYVA